MHRFYQHYLDSIQGGGYPIIVLLMAMESSVVPLPSELVIPIAAYYAAAPASSTSVGGVVLAAVLGSWIGATLMYWASRWAGRPLVLKFGRIVLVSPRKVEAAEAWSAHYGQMGVFISRLLPVVRHLIGIPSGIVRLNFAKYSLYTILGSAVWCIVLARVGIIAGNNPELMRGDLRTVAMWVIGAGVILGGLYYFFVYRISRGRSPELSRHLH
jgi:membrane protein DedA with SNARE-associated domain